MSQNKIATIGFVTLLLICSFILGYLAADNRETPEVHITQMPVISRPQETESASGSSDESGDPEQTEAEMEESGLININTADQAQLETLPGIGPSLAKRIIEYREVIGGFTAKEQLMQVSGIGQKKYDGLSALITVGGQQ